MVSTKLSRKLFRKETVPEHARSQQFALAITAKGALLSKGSLLILMDVKRRVLKYASEGIETLPPI